MHNNFYDLEININLILRKIRVVLDVGINYYGWTYDMALSFINSYLPKRTNNNKKDIERCLSNPEYSLTYYLGMIQITKLRDQFLNKNIKNIKDFHHRLLMNGACNFSTLKI